MNPLQIFEKHPTADAYRVGDFYSPYALISQDKRFADAELAAEYWKADADCAHAAFEGDFTAEMQDQFHAFERFATLPHFDA
jgi:hypothetical protein